MLAKERWIWTYTRTHTGCWQRVQRRRVRTRFYRISSNGSNLPASLRTGTGSAFSKVLIAKLRFILFPMTGDKNDIHRITNLGLISCSTVSLVGKETFKYKNCRCIKKCLNIRVKNIWSLILENPNTHLRYLTQSFHIHNLQTPPYKSQRRNAIETSPWKESTNFLRINKLWYLNDCWITRILHYVMLVNTPWT